MIGRWLRAIEAGWRTKRCVRLLQRRDRLAESRARERVDQRLVRHRARLRELDARGRNER